ncbi:MAG: hypothetical protein AAGC97_05745 [Planctomycetota bacterium]
MTQELLVGIESVLSRRFTPVQKGAASQQRYLRDVEHSATTGDVIGYRSAVTWLILVGVCFLGGCTLVPEARVRDVIHNPFPQLKTVAVLPFFNQSESPTLDGKAVGQAYYAALQSVPGFEVLPVGVTEIQLQRYILQFGPPTRGADFQRLAQMMDVEAIVVGSVTDFDAYYPPRLAMTVRWYAANEGFHEIPPGYGLPWGTDAEDKIPARIVREAEFELARSQLKTQTPLSEDSGPPGTTDLPPAPSMEPSSLDPSLPGGFDFESERDEERSMDETRNPLRDPFEPPMVASVDYQLDVETQRVSVPGLEPWVGIDAITEGSPLPMQTQGQCADGQCELNPYLDSEPIMSGMAASPLPEAWPDPSNLIPDPPSPVPPTMTRTSEPVLSHTRLYRGDDPYFTSRLADYVETGDDARGASWQGYVRRSDDFIRFCCHLHLTEMLEARGGRDPSELILRWPVSRY